MKGICIDDQMEGHVLSVVMWWLCSGALRIWRRRPVEKTKTVRCSSNLGRKPWDDSTSLLTLYLRRIWPRQRAWKQSPSIQAREQLYPSNSLCSPMRPLVVLTLLRNWNSQHRLGFPSFFNQLPDNYSNSSTNVITWLNMFLWNYGAIQREETSEHIPGKINQCVPTSIAD